MISLTLQLPYSICEDGAWNCGEQDCKTSVVCPNNLEYVDKFQRCSTTCSTYYKRIDCDPNEAYVDGCTCVNGTVLDHTVSKIKYHI